MAVRPASGETRARASRASRRPCSRAVRPAACAGRGRRRATPSVAPPRPGGRDRSAPALGLACRCRLFFFGSAPAAFGEGGRGMLYCHSLFVFMHHRGTLL
jgi:hypothetical protein